MNTPLTRYDLFVATVAVILAINEHPVIAAMWLGLMVCRKPWS